jgi:hypothetical protein
MANWAFHQGSAVSIDVDNEFPEVRKIVKADVSIKNLLILQGFYVVC